MSVEVERVDAGAPDVLDELLSAGDRPFIIPESIDAQKRESRWSPRGLRPLVGAREVPVTRADTGKFDYTLEGEAAYTDVTLPFAEALELIASARAPGPCYYLRRPLLSELGLDDEESLPRAFLRARGGDRTERLWVSSEGSITPLHYDTRNNFLAQMHGRKVVTLFPASEHTRIYPLGFTGTNLLSLVDPEHVDDKRFPAFPSDLAARVELDPGETLFIPPFWWHHVRSLDFSISVNVFWRLRAEQCLVANSVEYLRVLYGRDKLEELFADDRETAGTVFARLAEGAHERGLACAATLFCAASARATLRALAPDERDALSVEERRKVEHWMFLGDFAARTGKAPKSDEIGAVVAGVSAFASRPARWTKTRQSASIQE